MSATVVGFTGYGKRPVLGKSGEKSSSEAKARVYSVGFMRGLNPPSLSGSSFSAACEAPEGMLDAE
jgi:hypothetical protein